MTPVRRFAHRLALALGESNVDAMLARMPHAAFLEWIEYTNIEPFGEERADLRAGIIASTIANCLARKKGQPAFKVKDFMPKFEPPKQKTPDELFEQVQFLNFMFGGEYVDERMH